MEKKDVVKVLEAVLLLAENLPEKEIVKLTNEFSVSCAKAVYGFLNSYRR